MAWESKSSGSRKPRIAIACPFYENVPMEFVQKTWIPLTESEDWCEKMVLLSRAPSLPYARNELVRNALKNDADYLMFIDSDIIFEKNHKAMLKMLYDVKKPIVSGLYRSKKHNGFDYAVWIKHIKVETDKQIITYRPMDEKYAEKETSICQADLVGAGCLLVNADVFRKLQEPWFHWDTSKEDSEDFYFLKKAQALGDDYYPWVHMGVRCDHAGSLVVTCSGDLRIIGF